MFYILAFFLIPRCECYDYLFEIAVQMNQFGVDPTATPAEIVEDA